MRRSLAMLLVLGLIASACDGGTDGGDRSATAGTVLTIPASVTPEDVGALDPELAMVTYSARSGSWGGRLQPNILIWADGRYRITFDLHPSILPAADQIALERLVKTGSVEGVLDPVLLEPVIGLLLSGEVPELDRQIRNEECPDVVDAGIIVYAVATPDGPITLMPCRGGTQDQTPFLELSELIRSVQMAESAAIGWHTGEFSYASSAEYVMAGGGTLARGTIVTVGSEDPLVVRIAIDSEVVGPALTGAEYAIERLTPAELNSWTDEARGSTVLLVVDDRGRAVVAGLVDSEDELVDHGVSASPFSLGHAAFLVGELGLHSTNRIECIADPWYRPPEVPSNATAALVDWLRNAADAYTSREARRTTEKADTSRGLQVSLQRQGARKRLRLHRSVEPLPRQDRREYTKWAKDAEDASQQISDRRVACHRPGRHRVSGAEPVAPRDDVRRVRL